MSATQSLIGETRTAAEILGVALSGKLIKSVEWAFPSSVNAKGYPQGCYCVEVRRAGREGNIVFRARDRAEAVRHARGLTAEWCKLHLNFHPEDAE